MNVLGYRPGQIMKFNDDRLRIDKVLGNFRKSDKKNNKTKNFSC